MGHFEEGLAKFREKDYKKAVELLMLASREQEDNSKVWNALGVALSKANADDQAVTCFENALMLDPGNQTYQKNLDKLTGTHAQLDRKPVPPPAPVVQASHSWWRYIVGGVFGMVAIGFIGVVFIILVIGMVFAGMSSDKSDSASHPIVTVSPTQSAMAKTVSGTSSAVSKNDNVFDGFEISDTKLEKEQYASYVTGTVKNTNNKEYSYVQVEINLYDSSNAQVGSALANTNNLEPGGTWKFKAIILQEGATGFKIKGISAF